MDDYHERLSFFTDSSDNESEKTFAIIIGLLAGITLFIVFLVFMRRLFWGNGN